LEALWQLPPENLISVRVQFDDDPALTDQLLCVKQRRGLFLVETPARAKRRAEAGAEPEPELGGHSSTEGLGALPLGGGLSTSPSAPAVLQSPPSRLPGTLSASSPTGASDMERVKIRKKLGELMRTTSTRARSWRSEKADELIVEEDIVEAIILKNAEQENEGNVSKDEDDSDKQGLEETKVQAMSDLFDMRVGGDGLISFDQFWRWWSVSAPGDDFDDGSAFGRLGAVFLKSESRTDIREQRKIAKDLFNQCDTGKQ
jgi:hypothetical protein